MSDTPTETPKDPNTDSKAFLGIPIGSLITSGISLVTGIMGAGPWGIVGMALLSIGAIFGVNKLVGFINNKIDKADLDRAGADAGQTAVDLTQQIDQNKKAIQKEEDLNPPTKGFK